MITAGLPPILECSSQGDKRFSAMFARPAGDIFTIEERYQAFKVFAKGNSGNSVVVARGRPALNQKESHRLYHCLWELYLKTHPHLHEFLYQFNGYSDRFGKEGHACQAVSIFKLVQEDGLRPLDVIRKEIDQLYENRKDFIASLQAVKS